MTLTGKAASWTGLRADWTESGSRRPQPGEPVLLERRLSSVGGLGTRNQCHPSSTSAHSCSDAPSSHRPLSRRIHRSKLDRGGGLPGWRRVRRVWRRSPRRCRRGGPERGAVAQDRSGVLRAPARGCARRARACWREPWSRARAVSGRQAGSGSARSRASAAAHCTAQGQRFARCRVQRRAEWVSRPARAK